MSDKIIIINGPNLNLLGEREQSQYGSITFNELKENCIKKSREFGYVDRALSSLINRALFNNEALELGLSVSDRNVRDKIIKDDAFKDDLGQFSEL